MSKCKYMCEYEYECECEYEGNGCAVYPTSFSMRFSSDSSVGPAQLVQGPRARMEGYMQHSAQLK
jgi:hypothetical protein